MAFVSIPLKDRRQFLKSSVLGALAFTMDARAADAQGAARWALLSDTHIPADPEHPSRGFRPQDNLTRVVAQVRERSPAGMLISGDLARTSGEVPDYEKLRQLLEPVSNRMPIVMGLGNHDHRANFLGIFAKHSGEMQGIKGKHVSVMTAGPVRFVMLDSLLFVNTTPGLLGKAQRTWLDDFLKSSDDTPTLLVVHHTLNDGDGALLDTDRFFQIIRPHRKVKAVLFGHSHVYAYDELDGIHLINLPAVGYNFAETQPVGWVEGVFHKAGADLTLNAVAGNTAENGKTRSLRWRA
jgi:3',5'-cyclic AMP phosphodiesterase CpdA